jgi:hypothetical protein
MNSSLDIERVLDIWFEDGPSTVAERVVDDALRTVERTEQQRGWRSIVQVRPRPMPLRLATYAALALALSAGLVVVAGVLGGRGFLVAPAPTSSPSPSPTASSASPPAAVASATPVLRSSKPPRPAGATLLLMGNPMTAGQTYTTLSFEPAFTVPGINGWLIPLPAPGAGRVEGPAHAYFFGRQPTGNPLLIPTLSIIRPSQVITEGGTATEPAPADMLAWLQARTDFTLGKPFQVRIGDLTGTAVEGTVGKGAATNSVGAINLVCSTDNARCGWTNGEEISVGAGARYRFVVLDVHGQTVLLIAGDDELAWATDLPTLEQLMTNLTFPGPTG